MDKYFVIYFLRIFLDQRSFLKSLTPLYVLISLFFLCSVGFCSQKDLGRPSGKNEKFNVVLIVLHAFPRNHLGCYGYPENTSPAIDALSREGITFNNAFCHFPETWASMASVYTSLYPSSHQVIFMFRDKLPDRVYTLAEILKIHGYSTVWFGNKEDPFLSGADAGLLKGFDEVYQLREATLQGQPRRFLVLKKGVDEAHQLRESPEEILLWIKKHDKKQFFLTIHPECTHPTAILSIGVDNRFSRRVPREFFDEIDQSYKNAWMQVQESLKTNPVLLYRTLGEDWVRQHQKFLLQPYSKKLIRFFYRWEGVDDPGLVALHHLLIRQIVAFLNHLKGQRLQYTLWLLDSALLEADEDFVRQVVNTLKKEGVYDKTIIIVIADHGNEYGEHGHTWHGDSLYDEALRIPMIFHIPGLKSGVKIDSIVESVDLLPTICDLLRIPVPYQAQGVSLRRLWERGFEGGERYTISQAVMGPDPTFSTLGAIRSSRWKLIMDKKGLELKELYDIKKDPGELQNVISSNPEVAQKLSKEYISKIKSLPSYQNNKSEFFSDTDEETREKIQKMGYW